jgi:hypothetical protein
MPTMPTMPAPTIRPGDLREINGVPALIIKAEDDGTFLACPVKAIVSDEETTGNVIIVEEKAADAEELLGKIMSDHLFGGVAAALPEFSAAIYPEHIGKMLWRCFPEQVEKAAVGRANVFRDVPAGTFDVMKSNSEEDWNLYRKMSAPSFEKMFALEADTFVEQPDGTMRPETARERRNRLARRRRAMKK